MAKRTAVIDIGSNSIRLVIFEKTSRFAFHLLHEVKSRVRISENAYENRGYLQEKPQNRAFNALKEFSYIINEYKIKKTLCVATSALRDAPNKADFIKKVKEKLSINIKIIEGEKEAYLGGIAAANLLHVPAGMSIDIGGGSTELALFKDRKVTDTFSLNLGTVRLKELYFDKNDIQGAKTHIKEELKKLPLQMTDETLIGIGGTLRALSKMIMQKEAVYFRRIHGFSYTISDQKEYFESILKADEKELISLGVKEDRLDIIQAGLLILTMLIKHFKSKYIINSGVGVREGLFLSDLLRSQQDKFPHNYNPNLTSLLDRFPMSINTHLPKESKKIFDLLHKYLGIEEKYESIFLAAVKLSQIGRSLDFYEAHKHAYYMILNGLSYGYSHEDIIMIATLVRFQNKKQASKLHQEQYKDYLPKEKICQALNLLMKLTLDLFSEFTQANELTYSFSDESLQIKAINSHLLNEKIKNLQNNTFLKISLD